MKKLVLFAVLGLAAIALLIQLVPYGRVHTNPPSTSEPPWPDSQTRQLAQRACYDCHSNQTVWPWYSNVAPVSWLVARDVYEGRQHINFSEWGRSAPQHVDEFQEVLTENSMPPAAYLLLHPAARLSPQEKQQLAGGLALIAAGYSH